MYGSLIVNNSVYWLFVGIVHVQHTRCSQQQSYELQEATWYQGTRSALMQRHSFGLPQSERR